MNVSMTAIKYLSVLSPIAFTFSLKSLMSSYEYITFSNAWTELEYPIGLAIVIVLFDVILYGVIVIITDFLLANYNLYDWVCEQIVMRRNRWKECIDSHPQQTSDIEILGPRETNNGRLISIKEVCKTYDGETLAVNNVNLDIYEGQITAILGQNGAGKTSLINMMIGDLAPTTGQITIYGLNVANPSQLAQLQSSFGVCLQEDILFDELTCKEHLQFFARFKGVDSEQIEAEVKNLLTRIDLTIKKDDKSVHLSGGQKRKLCIGIALIGNPKIIFLDEPTSGIDPYSRRRIWSLLSSYKQNRIMILSTHFMDEADVLSDRKVRI